MKIIVRSHGMDITAPIKDYAHKKMSKLEQFFRNIIKVEVTLDHKATRDLTKNNVAKVSMWLAGKKLVRASAAERDIYSAIDLVFSKLEQQVQKHKKKRTTEKRREGTKIKEMSRKISLPAEEGPSIVKVKRFADKPMSRDEAKEELRVSDQDFILFREADSDKINLAYKKDGEIKVLSQDRDTVKPLKPEIAMEISMNEGMDFYMFLNSDTKDVNVVYRRRSGNYGLIEPTA